MLNMHLAASSFHLRMVEFIKGMTYLLINQKEHSCI